MNHHETHARIGCLQVRHSRRFRCLAWFADFEVLVTGSVDGVVRTWDRGSGRMQELEGHRGAVTSVAISPDGAYIASSAEDQTLRVWERVPARLLRTIDVSPRFILNVTFSANGEYVAGTGDGATVWVWDISSSERPRKLTGHSGSVGTVAFSPGGTLIATGADDQTICMWGPGDTPRRLTGHSGSVKSVAFGPDGYHLVSCAEDFTVCIWHCESGRLLRRLDAQFATIRRVAFSPDGKHIAGSSYNDFVCVWDVATGRLLWKREGDVGPVLNLAFSPNGLFIVCAANDGTVSRWHLADGEPGGAWDELTTLELSAAFSADWACIASALETPTVYVWETSNGRQLHRLEGHTRPVTSLAFSTDGARIASGGIDRTVRVWDARSGQLLQTLEGHLKPVSGIAFSLDDAFIASSADDWTIRIWDCKKGCLIRTIDARPGSSGKLVFSPDGSKIVSGTEDNLLRVWERGTGRLLRTMTGHVEPVTSIAFSRDGSRLVTGSYDRTVRIWNFADGRLLKTLEGHTDRVSSVALSADGMSVASSGADSTIRLWDAVSGAELTERTGIDPNYAIAAVGFLPPATIAPAFRHTGGYDDDIRFTSSSFSYADLASLHPTVRHVSAKIVLVGETQAGKSCLALRLTEDRYEEQGTTHGMRLWSVAPETIHPRMRAPRGELREVAIWDLGGQDEYRLVHQLFLNDTTIALLAFDPTRGQRGFDDIEEWNLRLKQQLHGRDTIKLLVGTKSDLWPEGMLDHDGLNQLMARCGIARFIRTSAKTDVDAGRAELREAIADYIDWDTLSRTTRRRFFQSVHDLVTQLRKSGRVFVSYSELESLMRTKEPQEFDAASLNTVLEQLVSQGVLVRARLASGQPILILQIGCVETYAGSLIRMARNNPRRVPALDLGQLNRLPSLPGMPSRERLPVLEERIVIECVAQLLLQHGICFEHERLLIYPALFPDAVQAPLNGLEKVTLYYDFTGAVDNIYSSLVVMLALGGRFGRVQLSRNCAMYELPDGSICGIRKVDSGSGAAHMDLLFGEKTPGSLRSLFTALIDDHLRREGVAIKEGLAVSCSCGYQFQERSVQARITAGHVEINCPECDQRNDIYGPRHDPGEDPQTRLLALKTSIQMTKAQAANEVTQALVGCEIFVCYCQRDQTLLEDLSTLVNRLLQGLNIQWNPRPVDINDFWRSTIDHRLESADLVLMLITPDFLASNYITEHEMRRALELHAAGETRVIPILLQPANWGMTPLGTLQALPIDSRPISTWQNKDEAFANVVAGIRAAIEQKYRPPGCEVSRAEVTPILWRPQPTPPIRILHLSDLHFAESDDPSNRLQPLLQDLEDTRDGFGGERLDYLIVSGDLTNSASQAEYECVHQFLSRLIQRTSLSVERCVVIPGNHDVNWRESPYTWKSARQFDPRQAPPGHTIQKGDGYLVRDTARYPARFQSFRTFYHQLTQRRYPEEPEQQSLVMLYETTGIQLLALNSAWEIDEQFPHRSGIEAAALSRALTEADDQIKAAKADKRLHESAHVLRIAIWHHPITGNEKIQDDAFVERLRKANVRLCLHGHVHEDRADVIGYVHPSKLYVVGAGSFGAPARHRPESAPCLYNLLEIQPDHSRARVYTRRMAKTGGAWEGWAVWSSHLDKFSKQSYYDIELMSAEVKR